MPLWRKRQAACCSARHQEDRWQRLARTLLPGLPYARQSARSRSRRQPTRQCAPASPRTASGRPPPEQPASPGIAAVRWLRIRGTARQAIRGADAGPGSGAADRPMRGSESADRGPTLRRSGTAAGPGVTGGSHRGTLTVIPQSVSNPGNVVPRSIPIYPKLLA